MKKYILFLFCVSACVTNPPVTTNPPVVENPGSQPQDPEEMLSLVDNSACAKYSWKSRGVAPKGYMRGVALSYANFYCSHKPVRNLGSSSSDALAYYGLDSSGPSEFALLLGLGMRESSGQYCEGYDTSAGPEAPEEAEAGLYQFSFNSIGADSELKNIYAFYKANPSKCFLDVYKSGVSCGARGVRGSGEAAAFQTLAKTCPGFATEYGALLIRVLRKHFGPINRGEAEYNKSCVAMFKEIESKVSCK